MRIIDAFNLGRRVFSFEFFPPKTDEGVQNLFATIAELAPLNPSFVSVTYGAGGSTRAMTVDLVARIKQELGIETMAHLTCVGHTAEELAGILDELAARGVQNVLPLRGDPPRGESTFVPPAGGFGYAQELVRYIRPSYEFCLAGACYPEGHPESPDRETDLRHLKEKADSGVDFLITQLFFDVQHYFRFVERARSVGITQPIVPGIMPVTNVAQIERFTALCGARIPAELQQRLDAVREDDAAVGRVGIDWATSQCEALLHGGAPGIHFYTLNRSLATRQIFTNLQRASVAL
jgi:methylenetetrahydrofolate reductase (NADPH)